MKLYIIYISQDLKNYSIYQNNSSKFSLWHLYLIKYSLFSILISNKGNLLHSVHLIKYISVLWI
jgi:hypothetical protein